MKTKEAITNLCGGTKVMSYGNFGGKICPYFEFFYRNLTNAFPQVSGGRNR
jgi:hypothetical protein